MSDDVATIDFQYISFQHSIRGWDTKLKSYLDLYFLSWYGNASKGLLMVWQFTDCQALGESHQISEINMGDSLAHLSPVYQKKSHPLCKGYCLQLTQPISVYL